VYNTLLTPPRVLRLLCDHHKMNRTSADDPAVVKDLIDRILDWTKSPESRNFYRKAIVVLGTGIVNEELSVLKDGVRTGRVRNPAHYFTRQLKNRMGEMIPSSSENTPAEESAGKKPSSRGSYLPPSLPDLFDELKPVAFRKDATVTENLMDFPYTKDAVPWPTLIGSEFFTLSTDKRRSDIVKSLVRTFSGNYRVTLVRGKFFPEAKRQYGILTATQARILGAVGSIWANQGCARLVDGQGNFICRCTFSIRQLADLLGWKRSALSGDSLKFLKESLADLCEVPYCYRIDRETAVALGWPPEAVNMSFKLLDGVDFLQKEGWKGETRCEIRFSPQYSRQLWTRRTVRRPLETLTIRSEIAVLLRQHIEPVLMSKGDSSEYFVELALLIKRLNLPKAIWHKHKGLRKQQFAKAIREIHDTKTVDGRTIQVQIDQGLNPKDYLLVARLVNVDDQSIRPISVN